MTGPSRSFRTPARENKPVKQMARKETAAETGSETSLLQITDFLFSFCGEKNEEGEDSYVYALHERCAMLGVFGGRSGPGDRRVPDRKSVV